MNENKIRDIAYNLDWYQVDFGEQSPGRKYVEFFKQSPAGEDFSFCVFYEDEYVAEAVREYAWNFDIDEHIEMWLEAKRNGVSGVPSARKLVDDARAIADMLRKLAEALG